MQYRRGDEPWRVVKLGAGTLVRQQEERVIVEAEDGDSVDLVCFRSVLICVGLNCAYFFPCLYYYSEPKTTLP